MTSEPRWRYRWILYAVGAATIGGGIRGVFIDAVGAHPLEFAKFFVGSAVVHDGIIAPLVVFAGWLAVRRVPARARGVVQTALLVSGTFVVVALPVVAGFGRRADNSSALPQNYGLNLVLLLALVWLVAGIRLWWTRPRRIADE